MPSLRTIFLVATAALASFAYAAPVGPSPFPGDSMSAPAGDASSPLPEGPPKGPWPSHDEAEKPSTNVLDDAMHLIGDAIDGTIKSTLGHGKRGEPKPEPDSLPVILLALEAKLQDISKRLIDLVGEKTNCDVEIVSPILKELHSILLAVVASLTALIGLPLKVVLALSGKILTTLDIANLLCKVLTLLTSILVLVVKAVGLGAATPLITLIAGVVAQILTVVLKLVVDLLPVLVPLLKEVIAILIKLKLGAILTVLKVDH